MSLFTILVVLLILIIFVILMEFYIEKYIENKWLPNIFKKILKYFKKK